MFSTAIEYRELPEMPDSIAIQITADTCEQVQTEINRIFEQACRTDGVAEFRNPYRAYGRWQARGYVTQLKG